MYNYNNTINRFDKINEFIVDKKKFIIPQHIYRLLIKLKTFDHEANVNHILRLSATNLKQDPDLKKIFQFFKWNDDKRIFETEIKREELINKIESAYDIKMTDMMNEDEDEVSQQINRKESLNSSNFTFSKGNTNQHGIYNSLNEEFSFPQNRNGKKTFQFK